MPLLDRPLQAQRLRDEADRQTRKLRVVAGVVEIQVTAGVETEDGGGRLAVDAQHEQADESFGRHGGGHAPEEDLHLGRHELGLVLRGCVCAARGTRPWRRRPRPASSGPRSRRRRRCRRARRILRRSSWRSFLFSEARYSSHVAGRDSRGATASWVSSTAIAVGRGERFDLVAGRRRGHEAPEVDLGPVLGAQLAPEVGVGLVLVRGRDEHVHEVADRRVADEGEVRVRRA